MQTPTPFFAKGMLAVILITASLPSLQAQIFTDAFSFGASPSALSAASTNWVPHSGTGLTSIQYQTSGLTAPAGYPNSTGGAISFAGGSGSREDISRSITSQNSGTVYAASLVNLSSSGNDYFFHFNIAAFIGRVFTNNVSGNLRFGISKTGTASIASTNFVFNTTYLMVVKFEFVAGSGNDIVSLWVLPEPKTIEADAGSALATDAVGTDPASLIYVAVRQGTSSAVGVLDELRIANTWEEAVATSVWNGSTWSLGTPGSNTNIKLTSNLSLGSSLSVKNICFVNNSELQIGSNQLNIAGGICGNGFLASTSNSEVVIGGNAGTLNFSVGNRSIKNLNLSANANCSLGTILNVVAGVSPGTLTLGNNASIETNGNLTLQSDVNGTARIAAVATNATLNGQITVERYLPARRSFRFLSSPVTTNTGIQNTWQLNTHITGLGTGLDASNTNNASMFILNEDTQLWTAITNSQTQNLQQGIGYRMLVRGNRTIDINNNTASPTACVLSATGVHQTGDKTYNSGSTPAVSNNVNAFSFLGNPFPSSINWDLISRNNVSATYYTWRAQGGSNNKGAYVNYNGTGQVSSDGNVNAIIGSGSAFMVQTTGPSPSLTIEENDKVNNNQGSLILGKKSNKELRISVNENDSLFVDGLLVYENPQASNELDDFDSEKWMNPGFNIYIIDKKMNKLSIQGLQDIGENKIIQLGMEKAEEKTYSMIISGAINFGKPLFLVDQYAMKSVDLNANEKYNFVVNQDNKSKAENRFYIQSTSVETGLIESKIITLNLFPNPAKDQLYISVENSMNSTMNYQIFNQLGKQEATGIWHLGQPILTDLLTTGIYYISLTNNQMHFTKAFIKQ